MRDQTLWKLAGVAALAGGLIDLAGPLVYPHLAESSRQVVYVVIDVLLLLGMLGVQFVTGRLTGWWGVVGLAIGASAVLVVRSSAALGPGVYPAAAAVWVIGMVLMSLGILRVRAPLGGAASLWLATFVIGLVGLGLKGQVPTHRIAAAAFALGFVVAGVRLITLSSRAPA
jgi:hypothetical protein